MAELGRRTPPPAPRPVRRHGPVLRRAAGGSFSVCASFPGAFYKIYLFIHTVAVWGLCSCGKQGCSLTLMCGPRTERPPRGSSGASMRACGTRALCPIACGIFPHQGSNLRPLLGRQILNCWSSREVLKGLVFKSPLFLQGSHLFFF